MEIRKFNQKGIEYASDILDNYNNISQQQIHDILSSDEYTVKVSPETHIDNIKFTTRFDAAQYLHEKLDGVDIEDIHQDVGLWTWLALFFNESLVKSSSAGKTTGAKARWILDPNNHMRYYRHLLAGPYIIYKAYINDADAAMILLFQKIHTPGEIIEQIVSRQELVQNKAFLNTASKLYYDSEKSALKHGSSSKSGGSPRRLADIFSQFELTRDMFALDCQEILTLLPIEFKKFKKTNT